MRALEQWADNRIQEIQRHIRGLQASNPTVYESQKRMWEDEIARTYAWVASDRYWRLEYRPSC